MLRKFLGQFLLDLGKWMVSIAFPISRIMSGKAVFIAVVSVLSVIGTDGALCKDQPDLRMWLMIGRGGFALVSILVSEFC
jgi:hypothetical protein